MFVSLANAYASAHPSMPLGHQCQGDFHFPRGITNGARWYELTGNLKLCKRGANGEREAREGESYL